MSYGKTLENTFSLEGSKEAAAKGIMYIIYIYIS